MKKEHSPLKGGDCLHPNLEWVSTPLQNVELKDKGLTDGIQYSIIVPLKNEEGNILELVYELESVMQLLNEPWELICIDDGSTDHTLSLLEELAKRKKYLRIVVFAANFGQSSAFDAGFKNARGRFIITIDGDRQNDPQDIPKLIKMSSHYDMVCGFREKRKDSVIKKLTSFLANAIRKRVCKDGIADTGCSLKIYRKECLQHIKMYHGMHRFLPALFLIEGFTVGQIAVNHRQRLKGKTKYNLLNRSVNTIEDMLAVRWMRKRKLSYKIAKVIE